MCMRVLSFKSWEIKAKWDEETLIILKARLRVGKEYLRHLQPLVAWNCILTNSCTGVTLSLVLLLGIFTATVSF